MALAPEIQIVGEAASGQEVIKLLAAVKCDLLLLDMAMPGLSGIELIRRVRQSEAAPSVLVLSMHKEAQLVSRALKAGAAGYLTKDSDPETLIAAIRKIGNGGRYLDATLVDEMIFEHGLSENRLPHEKLSNREFQILLLLVAGHSVNSIADSLSLSAKTVSTHKMRMMQKMQMRSIAELTRYALEHRLTGV